MSTSYARVNEEVEAQPPLLRVTSGRARRFYALESGKAGNLQTAAVMASLVRDAAVKDKQLELWVVNNVLIPRGLDSHSDPYEIADTLLQFCQRFTYVHDPAGAFDSVQSARTVIADGKGDCDDLSVLLATTLALVGFKPRFVLARYKEDTDGFDHVYVDLELPRGRVALDPTSRRHGIGWESPKAIERVAYPIFDGKVVGLGNIVSGFKSQVSSFLGLGCCSENSKLKTQNSVTAGSGGGVALGGVSLSLPAVLFSMGTVLVTLKAVQVISGDKSYV